MLTIFCGEDASASRAAFIKLIDDYKSQDAEIISLQPSSILEVQRGLADNLSLFSSKKIFCVEGLEKFSFKKSTKVKKDDIYEAIVSLSTDKNIVLLDFEEGKPARQLKLKDFAKVYESKPSISIFKLLEDCFPGNKLPFISSLQSVCNSQEDMFVFVMLFRHIRQLLLSAHNVLPPNLPPWQKYKVLGQAKKWSVPELTNFYSGLIKIEITSKTSSNPYGIRKSLEILACHYL